MSKEWLEDIRETMDYIKIYESKEMNNQEQADMTKCYLIERYGDWLIEQAELVQELKQQNKRYREALEFYADRENYEPEHYDPDKHDYTSMIDHDKGATARKALVDDEE